MAQAEPGPSQEAEPVVFFEPHAEPATGKTTVEDRATTGVNLFILQNRKNKYIRVRSRNHQPFPQTKEPEKGSVSQLNEQKPRNLPAGSKSSTTPVSGHQEAICRPSNIYAVETRGRRPNKSAMVPPALPQRKRKNSSICKCKLVEGMTFSGGYAFGPIRAQPP